MESIPLLCFRHIRMPWKIQYKAHEIHPNHKENHFLWNFSFKYFAVSIIIHNFALAFNKEAGWLQITPSGEMVEWSITTVLKTVVPRGTGGSNPSLSANKGVNQQVMRFTPFITPKIKHLRKKLHPRLIVLGVVRYWERFIGLRKARFHIRYNPNQPFGKT